MGRAHAVDGELVVWYSSPNPLDDPLEIASKGMFSRNLWMDAAGLRRGSLHLAWDDIEHYFYDLSDWRKRGDFILVAKAGTTLRVEPIFDHWSLAAERILGALHPRLRAQRYYAPFAITGDHLERGGTRLALADIAEVELAAVGYGVGLFVHPRTGREWDRIGFAEIANLWLFLEDLVAHGVAVRSELDFQLPPPLFPLVAHMTAARQLPVAKLVT